MGDPSEATMTKKKKQKTSWIKRWTTYFTLATLLFLALFAWSEYHIETKQPSEDWSMGLKIMSDLPTDYRLIDQTMLPDGSGFVVAYYEMGRIHLSTFDWKGKVVHEAEMKIKALKPEDIKLLSVTVSEQKLMVYYGDRFELAQIAVDPATLTFGDTKTLSTHAEQFSVDGDYVVAADDQLTEVFKNGQRIATFTDYVNVKRVCIASSQDKIIVAHNAEDGGRLLTLDTDAPANYSVTKLTEASDQKTYGYFKDIHLQDGVLTIVSSVFDHLTPSAPTVLGVWQLEEDTLKEISFKLFYHVRTSLDPVITGVEGKKVSYILGTQQTLDTVNKGLSRYPQTRGGLFTNVSHFTREGDILVENTRLTLTRKYPVGYATFDAPQGKVLTWADKVEGKAVLMMASQGDEWIAYAKSHYEPNYMELISASLMAIGNTIFFGIISMLISMNKFYIWIGGFIIAIWAYNRFAPLEQTKKATHVLWISILVTVVIKFLMVVLPSSDYHFYAHIYPWLFGNQWVLAAVTLVTSLMSIGIFLLWKKQHYYYTNRFTQFSVFFGIELYLFQISIMAYFVSGMMKNNFMM